MRQINPKRRSPAEIQPGDVFQVIDAKHAMYGQFVTATERSGSGGVVGPVKANGETWWRHQLAYIGEAVLAHEEKA